MTANTIDQRIVERAASKRKLEKMIIHKGEPKSFDKSDTIMKLEYTHMQTNTHTFSFTVFLVRLHFEALDAVLVHVCEN